SGLGQRFLENPELCLAGSKFRGEVARIAEGAQFKYVMQLYEQKKDYALAAKEFRAFVGLYPKSEHAPKALYNALVIADKADELDVEIAAGEQLLREYPSADAAIVQRTVPALASACERDRQTMDWREIETPQAGAHLAEVGALFARLPGQEKMAPVIDAAAHARFLGVEPSFDEFIGIHFHHARQVDLVRALKLKSSRM